MHPIIAIVQSTPSFRHIWPALAEAAGATARVVTKESSAELSAASVIIISAGGAEADARDILTRLRAACPDHPPLAVVGAIADHRLAIELVRDGATDYFALPADVDALSRWLTTTIDDARQRLASETHEPRDARHDYSRIVGRSAAMRAALTLTSRITPHRDATVLVTGETGTGKELIARAIHYNGPRASHPFVEVNCSAIPANLIEAELFGYEAGAFTDARAAKPGLFEVANGGTILLDEVGELPIDLQAKLLRALEDRQLRRLGATKPVSLDVRIIAATHAELASAVRHGRFRQDLYYRLDVFRLHLPPLRDRGDDVLRLAEHFLREIAERHRMPAVRISADMRRVLLSHSWPGNVRELRNVIERVVVLGESALRFSDEREHVSSGSSTLPFPADMEAIQQAAARAMVERHRGNKSAAAGALGISRKRLYTLLSGPPLLVGTSSLDQTRPAPFVHERPARHRASARSAPVSALWLGNTPDPPMRRGCTSPPPVGTL